MENNSYNCTFTVKNNQDEVFDAICRVSDWWIKNTSGSATKLNDTFKVTFGETFVRFKVVEMIPYSKVAWEVTDCYLHWINDKTEWKNTRLEFDIYAIKGGTQMSFSHVGLVPGIECYESCEKGWNFYAGESLLKLITQKNGIPDGNEPANTAPIARHQ